MTIVKDILIVWGCLVGACTLAFSGVCGLLPEAAAVVAAAAGATAEAVAGGAEVAARLALLDGGFLTLKPVFPVNLQSLATLCVLLQGSDMARAAKLVIPKAGIAAPAPIHDIQHFEENAVAGFCALP